ncbi:hypothetical protein [Saccharibacillus sacchari]|uniref:Uncharacterized protein n=1 Tax=Saccharibacillus sacchari TaxID=456493 RepID=A0ACC6PIK6_9BACL
MAKSASRKMRDKRVREGKADVTEWRSPFAAMDMRMRRTKTKQDLLNQIARKGRHKNPNFTGGDEGSFYFKDFFEIQLTKKS